MIIPCHSCTNIGFQDPINHKGSPRIPQDQPKNQCMHPEFQLPLHYSMLHVIFLLLSLQYYVLFVFFLCVCFFGHVYLMINKLINYKKIYTVNSDLSDTGLSGNLSYPTLRYESPSSSCVQSTLIYPTPGLSDTFMGNRCRRINQSSLYIHIIDWMCEYYILILVSQENIIKLEICKNST